MPLLISDLVKGRIFAPGQLKWSRVMIQNQLRSEFFFVSTGTISNVLRNRIGQCVRKSREEATQTDIGICESLKGHQNRQAND